MGYTVRLRSKGVPGKKGRELKYMKLIRLLAVRLFS